MQNILQILDRNSKATIKIFPYHRKIENTTAKHDGQWAFFKTKFVDQFLLEFISLMDNSITSVFLRNFVAKKA